MVWFSNQKPLLKYVSIHGMLCVSKSALGPLMVSCHHPWVYLHKLSQSKHPGPVKIGDMAIRLPVAVPISILKQIKRFFWVVRDFTDIWVSPREHRLTQEAVSCEEELEPGIGLFSVGFWLHQRPVPKTPTSLKWLIVFHSRRFPVGPKSSPIPADALELWTAHRLSLPALDN